MSDANPATHLFWLFAVAAGFAPGARAFAPSVVSTPGTEPAVSIYDLGTRSSVEASPPEASSDLPEASERRLLMAEFQPKLTFAPIQGEKSEIPDHPSLNERFYFGVGAFAATSSTEAALESSTGIGASVDFENTLGLDSNAITPQGLARWRFSERWRLEFEYFKLDRSATKTIDGDITWGDDTFPDGTQVHSTFDISVLRLSCGYSFFKTKDKEVGVALGFHLTDVNVGLSSSGISGDDGKLLAPLPVLSVYGQFALTDVWAISSRFDAFRMEYDPFQGHIYSLGLDALCNPWRNFGFGIGYRALDIGGSIDGGDWEGELRSTYTGPIVFATLFF